MKQFTDTLLGEMTEGLQKISLGAENQLQQAERSFFFISSLIKRLKEYILDYDFKDEAEEILFFKKIKPQFQSELIYFQKLYYFEANRPVGAEAEMRKYYKQELKKIDGFFLQYRPLRLYHLLGTSKSDAHYFVRNEENPGSPPLLMATAEMDHNFSTPHSYNLAKLQAYDQLKNYINNLLRRKQEVEPGAGQEPAAAKRRRTWTGPKAAAEEMVIGIAEMGWVNHGDGGIKELAGDFERMFNIKLDNIYRAVLGMAIRKKDTTPYINGMRVAVERKIQQKNE
ncbi:RteC domain-containing protein [Taibaiella koreensis]|uniref:RteC domain-containing protein n=1 Tax=Taibaiella koreensis TaxID=1268548 RepID=UPI0013C2F9AF|nr:RteC domain-containing protein [Taibaiella koreensis]